MCYLYVIDPNLILGFLKKLKFDQSKKIFCILNYTLLIGELKRKLMNELVDILKETNKEIRVLFFLGRSAEEDSLYTNFSEFFNSPESDDLNNRRLRNLSHENLSNCAGTHTLELIILIQVIIIHTLKHCPQK